jgi:hypothetical protein
MAPSLRMLIASLPMLVIGCATSQQDFETMSKTERQAAVCYGADSFKQRKEQMSFYQSEIEKKQVILSRGYRIHTQCQQIKVAAPQTSCGAKTGMGKTMCEGTAWTRDTYKTECTETPVGIDPKYEQETLSDYQKALATMSSVHSEKTQVCLARVSEMPPQAAYIYYSENMEPQ